MAVSRADALKIAALARLRLSEEEVARYSEQLSTILEHIDALAEADLADAEEAPGATEWPAPLRPDGGEALEGAGNEGAAGLRGPAESAGGWPDPLRHPLAELAPVFEDGFFTVPRLKALGEAREE